MRLIDGDALTYHLADYQLQESPGWGANGCGNADAYEAITNCIKAIEDAPTIEERKTEWIPIKWHDCTDADREKYGFNNDIVAVFDCEMPDDNQAILVTTSHGYVNQDVCYIDDGFSLDSGYDWIDDITAWMPLPKPYEGGNDA